MAKYKVGDKVLVKKNIKRGSYCMEDGKTRDSFISDMAHMCGKVVTIDSITPAGKYRIKEFCCNWVDGMFEGLANDTRKADKIVITTDGKTTTARLFDGKKMIRKAEARCSPDDEFDFMVGAELAMERLSAPEEKPVPEKKFVQHLKSATTGKHYGNIGEKTNYKDAIGRELRIGDTVEHFSASLNSYGEAAVVRFDGVVFIMGIALSCDEATGSTGEWKIIKKRSFDEVAHGEKVGCIKYIKEEV